jgi:ATP synthase I chain
MAVSDEASFKAFLQRVQWIILVLALAGSSGITVFMGVRSGAAFLIGAIISFASFWGWQRVVERLGPEPKSRNRSYFVLRLLALVAVAWVIIKYLRLNVAAAAFGLLVSGAAVVLELIYEMIYAS